MQRLYSSRDPHVTMCRFGKIVKSNARVVEQSWVLLKASQKHDPKALLETVRSHFGGHIVLT